MRPAVRFTALLLGILPAFVIAGAPGVRMEETPAADRELADAEMPRWRIAAETYKAEVDADGDWRIRAGEVECVSGVRLTRGSKQLVLGSATAAGADAIELREGEASVGTVMEPAAAPVVAATASLPGMRLQFEARRVIIRFLGMPRKSGKEGGGFVADFVLGGSAAGISNLVSGAQDALPARRSSSFHPFSMYNRLGHDWPEVAVTATNGVRCAFRGITGIVQPREVSGTPVAPWGAARVDGVTASTEVSLEFPPSAAPAAVLARIPAVEPVANRSRGLFPETEPVRYQLKIDPQTRQPGAYRLSWSAVDHIQRSAGSGDVDFDLGDREPAEVPIELRGLPMGYAYVEAAITRRDLPSVTRSIELELGRCRFEAPDLLAEEKSFDSETFWFNVLGFRGIRRNDHVSSIWTRFKDPANPENIQWDRYLAERERVAEFDRRGSIRTTVLLMEGSGDKEVDAFFRERYGGASAAARPALDPATAPALMLDEKKEAEARPDAWQQQRDAVRARWLKEWAAAAAKAGIHAWEPTNEPDLRMSPQAYLDNLLRPTYPPIKAGNPGANFLGGSCCGLEKHAWMRKLYELGGQEFFDGMSFHPYTGAGFQRLYRMHLGKWHDLFRDFKDDRAQGLYMTESANHRGWGYNPYVYERFKARRESHAHTGLHMMLNAEAMGIPRDRVYVFYAVEHGYNDFYLLRYKSPTPSAVAFQVMNECLRDSRFVAERPLPGRDHFFQVYADDSRTVAVLFTGGDRVDLAVITDAPAVEQTDCMGNRRMLATDKGRVQVSFDNFPVFLKVDAGRRLAPSYEGLMVTPNLALAALGCRVTEAGTNANPKAASPQALLSGDWTGSVLGRWSEGDDGIDRFPDRIEIQLPAPASISRVDVYHEYGGWQRTLRDFDIEVPDGGAWRKVAGMRGNYYAEATRHGFPALTTDRVRLVVHSVNTCLFGEINWIRKQTGLRAIAVHAAPQRPAAVFFGETRLDTPAVARGASCLLPFRVVNAGDRPFRGELRLTTPRGLAAASVPVELPAASETSVPVSVQVAPDAEAGTGTVLASVYAGDEMVSSDYDPRWVEVK